MSRAFEAVVIGGGPNGLVAAAALGEAGLRVLLLEREASLGGHARALEFAPGFHAAPLAVDPGWVPPDVERGLALDGLRRLPHEAPLSLACRPGEFLTVWRDIPRAAQEIARYSSADATRWPAFAALVRKLCGFLELAYRMPAPDVDAGPADLPALAGLARRFRGLGRRDMVEFLRFLPVSVWELLDDTFENDLLKAALAPGGVLDHRQGPRSGATGYVFLHHLVGAELGAMRGRGGWRDGPAAFVRAAEAAARRNGVTIRCGASVARISVGNDAATGVVLDDGEEVITRSVISTAGPRRTLLEWIDPVWLDPEFLHATRKIRFRGCTSFVLYALEGVPEPPGLAAEALAGVVSLTPSLVSLERAADAAKYGTMPARPHVEITVPSLYAPGLSPPGKHVLVARAQYAPYALRDGGAWDDARRQALAETVTAAIAEVIPGFAARVLHRVALTPGDLEETFGLAEGAPSHGELALDQILFMRPLPGWGRYATPIRDLYLGGAGAHPGPGVLGGAGWLAARQLIADRRRS